MEINETKAAEKIQEERHKQWKRIFGARVKEIVPGLFLGNVEASFRKDMLKENHVDAIVSLSDGPWSGWYGHTRKAGIPEQHHKWVQCVNSSTQDLLVYMSDTCDFIDQMASPLLRSSSALPVSHGQHEPNLKPCDEPQGAVLVHCDLTISRAPTIIIAYLMRKYGAKLEDVLAFVRTKQKVKPSANFTRQLQIWEQVGYQVWEDDERTIPKALYKAYLDDRALLLQKKGLTGMSLSRL